MMANAPTACKWKASPTSWSPPCTCLCSFERPLASCVRKSVLRVLNHVLGEIKVLGRRSVLWRAGASLAKDLTERQARGLAVCRWSRRSPYDRGGVRVTQLRRKRNTLFPLRFHSLHACAFQENICCKLPRPTRRSLQEKLVFAVVVGGRALVGIGSEAYVRLVLSHSS